MQKFNSLANVLLVNVGTLGFSIADAKEVLQLIVLVLSAVYTIIAMFKKGKPKSNL